MKMKKIIALVILATTVTSVVPTIASAEKRESNEVVTQNVRRESKFGVGQGIPWPEQVNAPYADMVAWINDKDYSSNGAIDLAKVSMETGIKYFNLGFIQSTGKGIQNGKVDWGWGGYSVLSENNKNDSQYVGIKNSIKGLRDMGGDVTISFGGLNGVPFWQVTQDVDVLYNTYLDIVEGYGLTRLDLDIEEGGQDKEKNRANAKAIKKLQEKTGVDVVLTLPVLPDGLTSVQLNVLEVYLAEGVDVECVNIMTMCYGNSTLKPGENYGTASLRAVDSTMVQVKDYYKKFANKDITTEEAYLKLGTTPSIGFEGSAHPTFTTDWTQLVVDHAIEKKIGMTSCWSINRDAKLDNNPGINKRFEFANIFKNFGSIGTNPGVNQKPVLSGVTDARIRQGESFDKLAGVTANDREDGDITSKIKVTGEVDTSKVGDYKLVYEVTDNDGATTTKERNVKVISSEIQDFDFDFKITSDWGSGANYKMTIKNNSGADIEGWKLELDFDKKLESAWSGGFKANGNSYEFTNPDWGGLWKEGEVIEIGGSCEGGIKTEKPTNIKVNGMPISGGGVTPEVNEKPVLNGITDKTIKIGDKFNPLDGITATDKEDGDITNKIKVTGEVNTGKVGTYKLVYEVTDSKGAKTSKERNITVKSDAIVSDFDFKFEVTSDWGSGANYKVTITN
ncbi:MAG: immunoglobulin-like domain-containing protein, partial [Clostridium sp.]|uniref:immunoglobulin-like domain-containing protein n=1 Tax=Clostridium sp. TaxID=1506 RepID=UPI003F3B539B